MSLLMCYAYKSVVGFHRYVVSSSASGSLDEMVEHQINQFDPPSEVRGLP